MNWGKRSALKYISGYPKSMSLLSDKTSLLSKRSQPSALLDIRGLSFQIHGDQKILRNISLQIIKEKSLCLFGPKGVGKSTLVYILSGYWPLQEGHIFVNGISMAENLLRFKSQIGVSYSPDDFYFYGTVLDYIYSQSLLFGEKKKEGLTRARENLRCFHLEDVEDKLFSELTLFERKKLNLAKAFFHNPQLVIFDEPTKDLNFTEREKVWSMIGEARQRTACTLLFTSTSMREAETYSDEVAVLDEGEILALGQPKDFILSQVGQWVFEFLIPADELNYYTTLIEKDYDFQVLNGRLKIFLKEEDRQKKLLELIHGEEIRIRRSNLSDVYMKLSGRELKTYEL